MSGTDILAVIGGIWLTYQIMGIAVLIIDKFIWHYSERAEKQMIHELLEDIAGSSPEEVKAHDSIN